MPSHIGPVLGRSSYIDDIAHGAKTWNQLCEDLGILLYRLRYWNISVSLPKCAFGKRSIPYLSHEISAEGIRATTKVAKGVMDLPFHKSHKGVLSFLGISNQPHLQKHLAKVELLKEKFGLLRLVHLKREYNQAANYLTTKTLILDESWDVMDTADIAHLEHVSKIAEKLMKVEDFELKSGVDPTSEETLSRGVEQLTAESASLTKSARVLAAVTRSRSQAESASRDRPMDPLEFQAERWRRIRVRQDADLSEIKDFLKEDLEKFSPRRLRKVAKVADLFVLDTRDVLYRLARSTRDRPCEFHDEPLVVPKALRDDVLHYGHEDFQGGHQGITRTHKRLCSEFYWPGMYADVEHFVRECVDCASRKGKPPNAGPSPGNIKP
ncbi:hypothetical protein PHMEG_00029631 [Phytophthora megakarya]|uniref:Integrase zinc-binding domain-containing protein n=1 Tax=Phytophthora megakarya TaxID=4795 RepID=A0A225V1P9_9STRA|nr:hypothetical protein PHMEG_00029631 [Phytophthora megakarya]